MVRHQPQPGYFERDQQQQQRPEQHNDNGRISDLEQEVKVLKIQVKHMEEKQTMLLDMVQLIKATLQPVPSMRDNVKSASTVLTLRRKNDEHEDHQSPMLEDEYCDDNTIVDVDDVAKEDITQMTDEGKRMHRSPIDATDTSSNMTKTNAYMRKSGEMSRTRSIM